MDIESLISEAREAMTARRVFGEPYERGGVTVIPAAAVRGASGGGGDNEGDGGGGFVLAARPVGAWVITDDGASWRPSPDVNRLALGGQVVGLVAVIFLGRILLARARRT